MPKELPVTIDVGLSAKLEATTEIPSDASGRAVHALVDAISPFTETMGLLGDQIRAVRTRRAEERLKIAARELKAEGRTINSVPDSFLLPWVERTSQDEGEDGLSEAWINLLKSASVGFQPRMKAFPGILSELTADDVKFLDQICNSDVYRDAEIVEAINQHLRGLQEALGEVRNPVVDKDRLSKAFEKSGLYFATKSHEVSGGFSGSIYRNSDAYDKLGSGLSVLEKNGLVISFTEVIHTGSIRQDVTYIRLTRLGFEFVQAARGALSS